MTYQFKYSAFIFDLIIFGILSLIGSIFLIWSLFTDLKEFQIRKRKLFILPIGLGVVFTVVIWLWNKKINANFDKPTLVRIFYDGDFNGTGIDFKTDGTYIFDNSAIGLSNYLYGEYVIHGDKITIDKSNLDNVVKTDQLEIRLKRIEYFDRTEMEEYVYQIDRNGNILKNTTEFLLVEDNRR